MIAYSNLVEALDAAPADRRFVTMWIDEDERETVTFGEFRRMARRQARVFAAQGINSGDRVIVIMPQGIPSMTTFVAAMMLGAVPAFLAYPNFKVEPSKYRSGLAGVTANLKAKAVIIDKEFPEEMLECVTLGEDATLLREDRQADISNSISEPNANIQPDSLAFIQHSAGTTGLQKGVALSHAAVLRQLGYLSTVLSIAASDSVYSWLPLYHDMGLIACFMLPMVLHLPVVMQSPIDWVMRPETMLQVMHECKCTLSWMPNFAFQFVPKRTPKNRWINYDLSCLRLLINCSEPVRASSMEQFRDAFEVRPGVLQSSYAMAENVFAVTQSDIHGAGPVTISVDSQAFRKEHRIIPAAEGTAGAALTFTSSGRLLPNHRLQILSDSGAALAHDLVGEIAVKSDCMSDGYYNRPDLTSQVMLDGWYRTGDLGFVDRGELYVVGRKKDLLIVGGENIYPQDIEEIVSAHPAIHDGRAIALGVYNPDLGTEDIIVVAEVEQEDLLAHAEDLEQQLRTRVVSGMGIAVRTIYLKPPKWIVKSTAGKPARAATREKLLREHSELNGDRSA